MTHAELVLRACRWLRNTRHCRLVLRESLAWTCPVIPDAIGWDGRCRSITVECKVSRADFCADRRKGGHLGTLRYYMAPPGLLTSADLPPGVGLLAAGSTVRVLVEAEEQAGRPCAHEVAILVAEFHRVLGGMRGAQSGEVGLFTEDEPELFESLHHFRKWMFDEATRARSENAAREASQEVLPFLAAVGTDVGARSGREGKR